MEKGKRLKLYSEKDYTETIDFPVELVGRDGVVRRYSYADSIRIYERRIESAHIRYQDREVINAEIYHCSRRLEQIRRSWKVRINSSERQFVEERPGARERELYERGKQFLRAFFDKTLAGPHFRTDVGSPNLVNLEASENFQIFYVSWPVFCPGTLLYAYRLEEGDTTQVQAYQRYVELLQMTSGAPDTEKLIYHEAGKDIGFILTSPRMEIVQRKRDSVVAIGVPQDAAFAPEPHSDIPWIEEVLNKPNAPEEGPFRQGIEALRREDFEAAFTCFRGCVEDNPYHKEAYWALAALSEHLRRGSEAEGYLLMAMKYFPEEPRVHYFLGALHLKDRRLKQAEESFQTSVRLNVSHSRAYGYLACVQALLGRTPTALVTLERGIQIHPRDSSLRRLSTLLRQNQVLHHPIWTLAAALLLTVSLMMLGGTSGFIWLAGMGTATVFLAARYHLQRKSRLALWRWARPAPNS